MPTPINIFTITVRTINSVTSYQAPSRSSCEAFADAIEIQGDTPCGITVTPLAS
jgi:hypothetical protein